MNQELVSLMKSHRKSSVDGSYQKASLREIEDKAIQLGKRIRGEVREPCNLIGQLQAVD